MNTSNRDNMNGSNNSDSYTPVCEGDETCELRCDLVGFIPYVRSQNSLHCQISDLVEDLRKTAYRIEDGDKKIHMIASSCDNSCDMRCHLIRSLRDMGLRLDDFHCNLENHMTNHDINAPFCNIVDMGGPIYGTEVNINATNRDLTEGVNMNASNNSDSYTPVCECDETRELRCDLVGLIPYVRSQNSLHCQMSDLVDDLRKTVYRLEEGEKKIHMNASNCDSSCDMRCHLIRALRDMGLRLDDFHCNLENHMTNHDINAPFCNIVDVGGPTYDPEVNINATNRDLTEGVNMNASNNSDSYTPVCECDETCELRCDLVGLESNFNMANDINASNHDMDSDTATLNCDTSVQTCDMALNMNAHYHDMNDDTDSSNCNTPQDFIESMPDLRYQINASNHIVGIETEDLRSDMTADIEALQHALSFYTDVSTFEAREYVDISDCEIREDRCVLNHNINNETDASNFPVQVDEEIVNPGIEVEELVLNRSTRVEKEISRYEVNHENDVANVEPDAFCSGVNIYKNIPNYGAKVWHRFDRGDRSFRIQRIHPLLFEKVYEFLRDFFMGKDPLIELVLKTSVEAEIQLKTFWRKLVLSQGLSTVCVEERIVTSESGESEEVDIVGVDLLFRTIRTLSDSNTDDDSGLSNSVLQLLTKMYNAFGVSHIALNAAGFAVHPDCIDMGIAFELIRTRNQIAAINDIKLLKMICPTSRIARLAEHAGYKYAVVLEINHLREVAETDLDPYTMEPIVLSITHSY